MPIVDILKKFGTELVQDIQENLVQKQRAKASRYGSPFNPNSNLYNSIKFDISNKSGSIHFELTMADYFEFVDKGRKPGAVSEAGQKSIQYWIKKKGIIPVKIISQMRMDARTSSKPFKPRTKLTFEKATKALTFLVARKLKRFGYDANFFYSEIILDGRVEQLQEDLKKELNEDILIEFKHP